MKLTLPKFSKKSLKGKPGMILLSIFLVILCYEFYLLYYNVYNNLTTEIDDITVNTNIVHLDLTNYKNVLGLLDSAKSYVAPEPLIHNPFK